MHRFEFATPTALPQPHQSLTRYVLVVRTTSIPYPSRTRVNKCSFRFTQTSRPPSPDCVETAFPPAMMPNIFRGIRDKTIARFTQAQSSKSSNTPLQTQFSIDSSTPQGIDCGTRSTLTTPTPAAESSQAADASTFPTGSHDDITGFPMTQAAKRGRAFASDELMASQLPPRSNTPQTVASSSCTIPPLTPAVLSTQTADALNIVPPTSARDHTEDPEWQTANPSQLPASGVEDASDATQSHHLSQLAPEQSGVAYEGSKTIPKGINDSVGMLPPLKPAAASLVRIITTVDVCLLLPADALHQMH